MAAPETRATGTAWRLVGFVLMLLVGLFPVLAAVADLLADARDGLASDHAATFTAVAGHSWQQAQAASPGIARYVTLLDRGYALHELAFGLLFLVIVAIPFRQRQRWAWWAAWLLMIANIGYTLIFGIHDHRVLARGLVVDIALLVLLLVHIPAFFGWPAAVTGATSEGGE